MIRQAISCDICGTEKRQTNHWFVAYEQAGELRIGGWTSRQRMRAGAKHLCGQICLHKLVDEYMAQCIHPRPPREADQHEAELSLVGDTSLTSAAAYPQPSLPLKHNRRQAALTPSGKEPALGDREEPQPSARLLAPPAQVPSRPVCPPQPEIVTLPLRPKAEELPPVPAEPGFSSRSWRAEAWERERERELRAVENRPDIAARRRSHA